jgi:hypothetical protein
VRCYFIRRGHIVDVEILSGLTDAEAVAKARLLFSEHAGPIEGFELWDRARLLLRHHPDLKNSAGKADESAGTS